eukprot:TRINITY_DN8628_c0_g1_i5.p1 TRINITY_DN8628_c0_g1~~TRINITY_DN8628_c0_g1_i5.p1  ORF type:complete len:511 (-),score=39.86 TRINITY_DN8628_c0_g1_i5:224-1756(-)
MLESFVDGLDVVGPYLDLLSLCHLSASSSSICKDFDIDYSSWHLTAEVTPRLWSVARLQARYAYGTANHDSSDVKSVDVVLPKGAFFSSMPKKLASKARKCKELIFDFGPVVAFQDRCTHTTLLTGDPWQPVVLKLKLDPVAMDSTLLAAAEHLPGLVSLRLEHLPAMALKKRVQQPDDADEPFAYPVIRQLPQFRQLRSLVLQSPRSHPNFLSVFSQQAFDRLVEELHQFHRLEELILSAFMIDKGELAGGRASTTGVQRYAMPWKPFSTMRSLKTLRLGAVHVENLDKTLYLNCDGLPDLEDLELQVLVMSPPSSSQASSLPTIRNRNDTPLGKSLKKLTLRGLPALPAWLPREFAQRVGACTQLEELRLAGNTLQEDFLEELRSSLEQGFVTVPSSLRVEWRWCRTLGSSSMLYKVAEDKPQRSGVASLQRLGDVLAARGGSLQVSADVKPSVDLRTSCEEAGRLEQRPCGALSWYGEGMEWFIGGVAPADLTMGQRAVINNRYSCS